MKLVDRKPLAPAGHPAVGVRDRQVAVVIVVGIMRAAFARQVAGVGDVQLEPLDPAKLRFRSAARKQPPQIFTETHGRDHSIARVIAYPELRDNQPTRGPPWLRRR